MKIIACLALASFFFQNLFSQPGTSNNIPRIIEKDGRHALLVDGKPFLMLGGQAHNSSAWPGMLPQLWTAVELMHANTLEVPIYWEQVEPAKGSFNFSLINTLLVQARSKLLLLWAITHCKMPSPLARQ